MTTIACDGFSMAGDGYITSGDTVIDTECRKVFRLKDGTLVGFAGNSYYWNVILRYLNGEASVWPEVDSDFGVMTLNTDGEIYLYDHKGRKWKRPAPAAIGTGRAFALGAMDAGKFAEDAVRIACNRDTHSGGTIKVVHLDVSTRVHSVTNDR
jgi:ATP-dependent HslUV protease subunit HslV